MAEAALLKERERRVLSIQSHVVHGYAGNKASVFPLQVNGFEVDFVNSVQFSNHAGTVEFGHLPARYEHVKGQRLNDAELNDLYEGLKLNNINDYTHILTGYCGSMVFLEAIAGIVKDLKAKNKDTLFVCDPVMGDHGRYYTPRELLPIYRDVIVPMADVVTPNAFELGELTGKQINNEADCLAAMDQLHDKGVRVVVVTSGVAATESELVCYASVRDGSSRVRHRFRFPRLPGQFVGTGDVFASLLIVWLDEFNGDVSQAVGKILGSLQALIKRTRDYAQTQVDSNSRAHIELRLIQSRKDLLVPPVTLQGETI